MNGAPETPAPQGPASAAPAADPLSAILAEMRSRAKAADAGQVGYPECWSDQIEPNDVDDWADRIEAAVKRELSRAAEDAASKATLDRTAKDAAEYMAYAMAHNSAPQPGSDAAMRAALVRILEIEGYGAPWLEAKCIAQKALEGQQCTPPFAQERPKIERPGNAAALREALEKAKLYFDHRGEGTNFDDAGMAIDAITSIDAALAAPARNADRFATVKDAAIAFARERQDVPYPCPDFTFSAWLFAPMKENGGKQ